jgi:nucleoside-diphosphate-sugar epimerase
VDLILSSAAQAHEVVEVFRGCAGRVVILSSMDVYRACGVLHGLEPGPLEPLPLTEASALRTKLQTYPPAQIAMLQQVFGWVDEEYDKIPVEQTIAGDSELPATVLRLPMVYGPGDPLRRFFPIVKRIVDGRRVIPIPADVAAWRGTKGYVENVAAAIALAATTPGARGRIYNVGDPDVLTELEWARLIAGTAGWTGEIVVLPPDRAPAHLRIPGNLAQHWVADTTRIRDELGYCESVPRDEAVRRTIDWERQYPPAGFNPHRIDYTAEDAALEIKNSELGIGN